MLHEILFTVIVLRASLLSREVSALGLGRSIGKQRLQVLTRQLLLVLVAGIEDFDRLFALDDLP